MINLLEGVNKKKIPFFLHHSRKPQLK